MKKISVARAAVLLMYTDSEGLDTGTPTIIYPIIPILCATLIALLGFFVMLTGVSSYAGYYDAPIIQLILRATYFGFGCVSGMTILSTFLIIVGLRQARRARNSQSSS